jgi:UDP-N-acetylglucosamine--N-acetylmuramyl-(pentapeptide) pyrophosphoryl-undecaprenol N-acetylglucosamine transferase
MTPGLTTKLSRRFARKICVSFQNTTKYFQENKVYWTGLPVRNLVFEANKKKGLSICGFEGSRPLLLVFGGSLGAEFLNNLVRKNIQNRNLDDFDVVNVCGKGQLNKNIKMKNYVQFESLGDDFLHLMQASDLVITRGGATSLFELLAMKKLHIIIPLSKKSSRGDQIENAQYFADLNVSSFIEEEGYSWEKIKEMIAAAIANKAATLSKIDELEFFDATQKVLNVIQLVAK